MHYSNYIVLLTQPLSLVMALCPSRLWSWDSFALCLGTGAAALTCDVGGGQDGHLAQCQVLGTLSIISDEHIMTQVVAGRALYRDGHRVRTCLLSLGS